MGTAASEAAAAAAADGVVAIELDSCMALMGVMDPLLRLRGAGLAGVLGIDALKPVLGPG